MQTVQKKIRKLVSKQKVRFTEDGFDLDLTYIKPNVIAMGFPSDDIQAVYRNPIAEVQRFFEGKHCGHYKIYNLCSEREYDPAKFSHSVARYPFDDHNTTSLSLLLSCCLDIHAYLTENPKNVAAIHCKAGKGRTGLVISCYLLYCSMFETAVEALGYFASKRTSNHKGVTIPSQIRYVYYFERLLKEFIRPGIPFADRPISLSYTRCSTVPHMDPNGGCTPFFVIEDPKRNVLWDSRKFSKTHTHKKHEAYFDVFCGYQIAGDVKLLFYHEDKYGSSELFSLWLNTSFIKDNKLKLAKSELDKAVKDSGHKRFDPGFNVEILFESPEDPGLDRENIGEQFEHLLDVFMRLKESIVTEKKKNSDLQRELEKVKNDYDAMCKENVALLKELCRYKSLTPEKLIPQNGKK